VATKTKPAPTAKEEAVAHALADKFRRLLGDDPSACWIWPGKPNAQGYGRTCHNRHVCLAHRISWLLYRGGASAGDLCVLHRCDNRICFNPAHLFLGDRGDNARDMAAKGRQHLQRNPDAVRGDNNPLHRQPELAARGTDHGCAVLTDAQVIRIRERRAAGESLDALGADFRISRSNVYMICRGATWRHVGGPRTPSQNRKVV
jgi:HNH endonuclease